VRHARDLAGDGPIRLLVTDLTTDGALRGYAQFDSWKLAVALGAGNSEAPEGYVPKLFGRGRLSFTVDQGQHTQRYQGVVPLEGASLADCAHTYFRQSEQLPTGIKIAAKRTVTDGTPHWRAAALMVQQMPQSEAGRIHVDREQREDDWRRAVILMASATEAEMLDPGLPAETLLYRLFHQEQPRQFARRPFVARCRCSRERIDRVLRSIKREELDDLRDSSGKVAVKCEFCSTEYAYDDRDLDRIYASAA
jgi:molecular chaperone Hsp33